MGDINSTLVCRTLFQNKVQLVDAQVTQRSSLTNFTPPPPIIFGLPPSPPLPAHIVQSLNADAYGDEDAGINDFVGRRGKVVAIRFLSAA